MQQDESEAATKGQEQGKGKEQSSGGEQSTDSKQVEQEGGWVDAVPIQGWNEAENSILEGVWVVDLTQENPALNQGEDTYMVRLPAFVL
jgi:hypothetical protein